MSSNKGKLLRKLEYQNLTRLWRLKPSTRLCNDFYVLDVETAHRPTGNRTFTPRKSSQDYHGVLKWQLKATPNSFVFGVIYGHNFCQVFHSVEEIKRFLLTDRFRNKLVFAHNGGTYDYPCIYGNPYDTDPEAIFNGKFISFTNGVCTFGDSVNIFTGLSIKAIASMRKTKKLGMSNNYSKSVWPKDYARDVKGCVRDCVILWEGLASTFEFAGEIKLTQASLSMTYYRRYHQPYHIDHNENTKHFFKSYYGGRTEAFKIGKVNAQVIDVNSMYPYHLRNSVFPNPRTLKHEIDFPKGRLKNFLTWYEGCADCTVIHKANVSNGRLSIGYLPVKKDGKLIFPIGTFRGTWNFPEIRYSLKAGVIKIVKVHSITYGEPMPSPFVSFVDKLHALKLEGQRNGDKWAVSQTKYFLNMLYGKFGQLIDEEFIYIKDVNAQLEYIQSFQAKGLFKTLQMFSSKRNDAFLVIGRRKSNNTPYSIPSFASYVTSYGRLQLLDTILSMEKNKVVYCDTDSIFFEKNFGVRSGHELGEWKLENKIVTRINGLKNYRYIDLDKSPDEIWRLKGVPTVDRWEKVNGEWKKLRKKTKLFDGNKETEVDTVSQTGENQFTYYNLIKTKEALRRGMEPGVLTKRVKDISNVYDKRIVFANGETQPIEL